MSDNVPIIKIPASSAGLSSTTDNQGGEYENPDTHPLPRFKLLELQFHLQRLAAMSVSPVPCLNKCRIKKNEK